MEKAPTDAKDIHRFIEEVPAWTAREHGKKYRLMYQVYTCLLYTSHGSSKKRTDQEWDAESGGRPWKIRRIKNKRTGVDSQR